MASALSSVLTIISTIIREEIVFLGGLRGELQSIKDEFQQMIDFLEGADLLVQDHPDVRSWVGQVRDVAYDVEDVLDDFVMHSTNRRSVRWYGVFRKMYTKSIGAIKARHRLAIRIQEIKKRIQDISKIRERYKTEHQSLFSKQALFSRFSRSNNMQYDLRGDALILEEADLVGITAPKRELIDLLLTRDDPRRNTISVVGMGGLGKTTLVKKVYDDVDVRSQFRHHVWINVSESFILEELFKSVIKQLFNEGSQPLPPELEAMDIDRLKLVVNDFLQGKKYIVVFDDVWDITHWNAIQLAFPKNQVCSRVVITTRNVTLGQSASTTEARGTMYILRFLNKEKATQLLCRKAFSGSMPWPRHLKQICEKIVLACKGLPLAIQAIGSILATRSRRTEEWELFYKRFGAEMESNSQLDFLRKSLSLSYYDLPLHLKNCLLYLSIFPKDTEINKSYVAQLWIAEGFVEIMHGMTLEEVADKYLNELIDRCLVQVLRADEKGGIGDIGVHDMIWHVILLKASEQNITTMFRPEEGMRIVNNVRRLIIQSSISLSSEQTQSYFKSMRTLIMWKNAGGNISEPFLTNLVSRGRKMLKVLDLAHTQLERIPDGIFKLFHLKFLNLSYTKVKFVPKSIGMLDSLQFLNLTGTGVTKLPVEIQKLQHLRVLTIGRIHQKLFLETFQQVQGVRASFRIGNLKSLQQLIYLDADEVDKITTVTEIGKLHQLRILGITKLKREHGNELCSSLSNLRELRELYVFAVDEEEVIDFQHFISSHLPRLQNLTLTGRLEKYPTWISSLHGLTYIQLRYTKLSVDPLECLHNLPNLITLYLVDAFQGESLCFKAGGFPILKNLHIMSLQELKWVTIEENAMPFLQRLWMRVCQSMEDIPTGIENLTRLRNLEFSNMCHEFVSKLENLDKQSVACERILQIPRVVISTCIDGRWSEVRHLNKETWTFNK